MVITFKTDKKGVDIVKVLSMLFHTLESSSLKWAAFLLIYFSYSSVASLWFSHYEICSVRLSKDMKWGLQKRDKLKLGRKLCASFLSTLPGTIQVFLQDLFLCKIEVTHNPYFLINWRREIRNLGWFLCLVKGVLESSSSCCNER